MPVYVRARKEFLMKEFSVQSFIDLVNFDQGTYAIQDEIEKTNKDVQALKQKEAQLLSDLEFIKKRVHDARKEVDQAELEMKELEQKEISQKEKLEGSVDQQEYRLLSKEIKSLKMRQHDYEEILLLSWNKFETAKKDVQAQESRVNEKIEELKSGVQAKEEALQKLEQDFQERLKEREEKTKSVPSEWMEKYVLMRSRVSNPVVPVVGGSCSACFYQLPPQDFLALKRNRVLQCKGCYRFLYVEPSE